MNTEEIYSYILTVFEGKSFENLILNKRNTEYKDLFENEYREKIINAMNTDEYTKVMNKLAKSFMTNLAKGAQTNRFTQKDCNEILDIYHKLIEDISNFDMSYEKIALEHFVRVRNFINDFTTKSDDDKEKLSYSPEFILKVLNVNLENIEGKGYEVQEISIDIDKTEESYGAIHRINLYIAKGKTNDVEPIEININSEPKQDESITEEETKEIKDFLKENYVAEAITINGM